MTKDPILKRFKTVKQDFVVQKSFQMTEDTIRNDFSWYKKKPFQMTKDPILKRFKTVKQDFVVQKSFQMTEDTIRNDFSWYKKKPFQMTKDPILKRFKTVSSIKKNIKKKMWKQNRHQA